MKKINKNPIDQYFREILKSPDLKFNKQDWKGFEKMLPPRSKKKRIAWWFPASVAAALMLFFGAIWLLNKPVTNTKQLTKIKQEVPKEGASDENLAEDKNTSYPELQADQIGEENVSVNSAENNDVPVDHEYIIPKNDPSVEYKPKQKSNQINAIVQSGSLYMDQQFKGILPQRTDSLLLSNAEISEIHLAIPSSSEQPAKKEDVDLTENKRSKLSLGLAVSPDINSVSGFKSSKIGQTLGLSANYRISPKLSISSGIAYSTKLYSARPEEYEAPWAYSNAAKYAEYIDADCRVLDVPVNLNYTMAKSSKQTMFVSAGLSSYFMLNEKYTLIAGKSQAGYPSYPNRKYEYSQENKHLFSVLNLSAGVSKPLNKQTSLVIEPYARLPLKGVGEGKVNLKSIGLNFQLQYNFRKKDKAKATSVIAAQ